MTSVEELRRLAGLLSAAHGDLGQALESADLLLFGDVAKRPRAQTVPDLALAELTEAWNALDPYADDLRRGLEAHFGPIQAGRVKVSAPSRTGIPLQQEIMAEVNFATPQLELENEFHDVLEMPSCAETLLNLAERLRENPPPAEVWSSEQNIQASWAIGRAGRLLLERAASIRRAALQRHPHLETVLPVDEEVKRVDGEVEKRLEELKAAGLYAFPEPPLFQSEIPNRSRSATVTDIGAARPGGVAKGRRRRR